MFGVLHVHGEHDGLPAGCEFLPVPDDVADELGTPNMFITRTSRENDKGLYATMIGGEMNLSAQDCCVERNYWLGSDGMLYNAGVLGMDSWEYANLKSHVRMGWYGARVNVHLLGLFHKATVTCKPCWATSPT